MARLTWNLVDDRVLAHFAIEGVRVEVQFEQRAPGEWLIALETRSAPGPEDYRRAFYVFNGVFQATEEFIAVREPDRLVFATKREQLAHVYELYLKREEERTSRLGYKLAGAQKVPPFIEYALERNRPSNWIE